MSDPRTPVSTARQGAHPRSVPAPGDPAPVGPVRGVPGAGDPAGRAPAGGVPAISASAMSIEDYARVVQTRTEFVDFLLAPARGELAAAA